VPVSGGDTLFSGAGNDTVFVRDGETDVVGCGSGRDVVFADDLDVVRRSCERVRVGEPRPSDDNTEVTP
jgi:Ca2+-binding RTX toxin-like protein